MSTVIYRVLPILAALILLIYLFYLLRNRKIQHRYVYLWSFLTIGVFLLAMVPALALKAANFLGFETAANLLLSIATFILLLSLISMSVDLARSMQREERIAQSVGLLENRVSELESHLQLQHYCKETEDGKN